MGNNGVNHDLLRSMYAAQFAEQKAEIDRLRARIDRLNTEIGDANRQIEEYKNIVFKMQMKLDSAPSE